MAEPYQQEDYYYNHTGTQSRTGKPNPTTSQVLALATLVPFGASLLILAGLTLAATVIGLTITAPLFVIFSPILLPAALLIGLAVAGFVTSGAFGVTSLSSFAWLANYLRRTRLLERLKPPLQAAAETMAQRAGEVVESVESKAQEMAQAAQSEARDDGKVAQTESRVRKTGLDVQSDSREAAKA